MDVYACAKCCKGGPYLTPVLSRDHANQFFFTFPLLFSGSFIEKIVVITKSAEEQRSWLKILDSQCEKYRKSSVAPVGTSETPSPIVKQVPVTQIPPPPKVRIMFACLHNIYIRLPISGLFDQFHVHIDYACLFLSLISLQVAHWLDLTFHNDACF